MKMTLVVTLALAVTAGPLVAQEPKPVPKDSMRVSIPGCTKGYVFTVGRLTADQPGTSNLPEGTHLRMNGPKKVMSEISARKGSMIEITGIMKKSDYPEGINIGGGVRVTPGSRGGGSMTNTPLGNQITIDVEGWRPAVGNCPR